MSLELNRVQMAGRLVKEPETKTLPNGTAIVSFSIAVGREFTAKGQEKQSDFFSVKAFSRTGQFIASYFHKGSPIYIEGALQTNNWTDKDGQKHYATDIVADKVKFVESANRGGNTNTNTSTGDIPAFDNTTAQTPKFETVDVKSDTLPF